MSDERRDRIAKALHEADVCAREESGDFGVATRPWDEADDYTRTVFGKYADAVLAALDAAPGAAPATGAEKECRTIIAMIDDEIERTYDLKHDEPTYRAYADGKHRALLDMRGRLFARNAARLEAARNAGQGSDL